METKDTHRILGYEFSPPFPTAPDAAGGCGNVDAQGSPLATPPLPFGAVLVGAAALVALRARWGRSLTALGAVVAMAVVGVGVTGAQYLSRYPPGFEWPQNFEHLHVWGLLAVFLLGADAVVELVRRGTPADDPPRPDEPSGSGR